MTLIEITPEMLASFTKSYEEARKSPPKDPRFEPSDGLSSNHLYTDMAYCSLRLAIAYEKNGNEDLALENIKQARNYLSGGPPNVPHRLYLDREWEEGVTVYNGHAKRFQDKGLEIELLIFDQSF